MVSVKAVDGFGNESEAINTTFTAKEIQVSADISSGTYNATQYVTLTASEEAEIYYTVDGSQPFNKNRELTESAKRYEEPIAIETSCVLNAAVRKDNIEYGTFSWNYVIEKETEENENQPQEPQQPQAPQQPQEPQQPQQPEKHSAIKTGDESSLLVYGVVMMVALGAGVIFRKREEH